MREKKWFGTEEVSILQRWEERRGNCYKSGKVSYFCLLSGYTNEPAAEVPSVVVPPQLTTQSTGSLFHRWDEEESEN